MWRTDEGAPGCSGYHPALPVCPLLHALHGEPSDVNARHEHELKGSLQHWTIWQAILWLSTGQELACLPRDERHMTALAARWLDSCVGRACIQPMPLSICRRTQEETCMCLQNAMRDSPQPNSPIQSTLLFHAGLHSSPCPRSGKALPSLQPGFNSSKRVAAPC